MRMLSPDETASNEAAASRGEVAKIRGLVVKTGNTVDATLRALRPRGLGGSLISLLAAIALLYYGRLFLVTISTAIIIVFILEPFVELLIRMGAPRALASFIVCSFAVCAVYLAGLVLYQQGVRLVEDVPRYAERIGDLSDGVLTNLENMEQAAQAMVTRRHASQPSEDPSTKGRNKQPLGPAVPTPTVQEVHIQPESPPLVEFIHSHLGSLYEALMMASFVPFLVYFTLSWRDHIRPSFLELFDGPDRIAAATSLDGIASLVRAFVVGNFQLAVVLVSVSTAFFWVFRLPYPMLIGPLSGILSLVPSFGLPLALLPPLLAALPVYSRPAPYLIIVAVVALLHLLAMNILYPKMVGRRVHLNPLMVAAAMMFWSILWGAAGLVLAVPLTAGLKAVCDHVKSLERYGRILGDRKIPH